jgi:hypothetical protein
MNRIITLLLFVCLSLKSYTQQPGLKYQIRYKQNKYLLSGRNKEIILSIIDTLQGKGNYLIYINGHSDSDADSSYNQLLSLKRSLEVKTLFVQKGIDEELIKVQAQGEEQPLVENRTPLEKAKNRRVEIVVLFSQKPAEKNIEAKQESDDINCKNDTTVRLTDGYVLTLSKCDWQKNKVCLRIEKKLDYKIRIKENWLKKHIGFKNYRKHISYEPHYKFYVVACFDSCFKNKVKLFIPHSNSKGLKITETFSQKKNNKNQTTSLKFKNTKLGDSAYYVADIYCPGFLNCGTDNRCNHNVNLITKNKIKILSYSYYTWNPFFHSDSIKTIIPKNQKKLTETIKNTFFQKLTILHKGDTVQLRDFPIEVLAHGLRKVKTKGSKDDKKYFLFIPYRKKYKCRHFKKYKIRAKDIENLKNFNIQDLKIEYQEE